MQQDLSKENISDIIKYFEDSTRHNSNIITRILEKFEYNDNYKSAFGGEPSYFFPIRLPENKIKNQAIDYVLSCLKYN
jgi:hypothetical protein